MGQRGDEKQTAEPKQTLEITTEIQTPQSDDESKLYER